MKYKIAAAFLSVILLLIVGVSLLDLTAFELAAPGGTTFAINDWEGIGRMVGDWLWSYRSIDLLVQVTLLFAAVIGASAMFRTMRRNE
ncbi:MAG: hypothetical protein EAX81_01195 [Candidatus Thorarchaeota archaeon]|nr:hypothetical protein [Candidatus Thorarchaeota archaeon]